MIKQDQTSRKVAVWRTLKQQNLIEKFPPSVVDILLNYDGELSLNEHLRSEEFFVAVKTKLKKYPCYENHGVDIDALKNVESLDLLHVFAYGLVGRLKCKLGTSTFPLFTDNEVRSLFWKHILRKIPQFDPHRGGWESYLQRTAFRDVKKIVVNTIEDHKQIKMFDVVESDWNAQALLPSDAREISRGICSALRCVLTDEDERSLFADAIYSGRSFIEIAASRGISSGTISLRLNSIRERLADVLEKKFGDFARRMPFQRFEVFGEIFRESISLEDFRKIF